MNKFIFLLLLSTLLTAPALHGQVTIGSGEPPVKAALLDIKQTKPDNPSSPNEVKNITSVNGGLLLPRVNLIDMMSLEPFVETTDSDYAKQKTLSVGLIVYNLTENANQNLVAALYYWDGISWNRILHTIY